MALIFTASIIMFIFAFFCNYGCWGFFPLLGLNGMNCSFWGMGCSPLPFSCYTFLLGKMHRTWVPVITASEFYPCTCFQFHCVGYLPGKPDMIPCIILTVFSDHVKGCRRSEVLWLYLMPNVLGYHRQQNHGYAFDLGSPSLHHGHRL